MLRRWWWVGCMLIGLPALAEEGASTSGAADPGATDADIAAEFNRELLSAEQRVDELKERVFRSKATLQLLRELIIEGSDTGSRAAIWHVNKLGSGFKLESVTYRLDDQNIYSKANDPETLASSREFKIHDGTLVAGDHELAVSLKVRPTGFGLFKYVQDYEIEVRSKYEFSIEAGKQCTVRATVSDRGGLANSFEERARVEFETKCERMGE